MQRRYDEILELGAAVYFIGPETRDNSAQMMEKTHASIPLLFDRDGAVMEAYRIAFEIPEALHGGYGRLGFPDLNPATGWKLPLPATFVLDRDGIVRARYVNADYTRRMEPQDIVDAVRGLAGG